MIRFITIYPVDHFIPYKQTPEFLQYLAHRDGLLSSTSEAHYYIVHHQKELMNKPIEIIEQGLIRHFLYIPSSLFRLSPLLASFLIIRQWKKFSTQEQTLVINNTFHQVGPHLLARVAGWRSLKIVGTFFHHARQGWKQYVVDLMEWLHQFLATKIMIISPSGWKYVPKQFHYKTNYCIPNFLYDAPPDVLPKINPRKPETPYSAICLSRLEPEKGLVDLIEAWKSVDSCWYLTIYGDGGLKSHLLNLIHTYQLSHRIFIKDPVAHAQIFSLLARHHVFVLTSPCEGLGICYLEALHMRTPCVGLDVPGVKDTLADGRGILLDSNVGKSHMSAALHNAMTLGVSPQWHRMIEEYFTISVFPLLNRETSSWFEKPEAKILLPR